jgi:hypothetical protein
MPTPARSCLLTAISCRGEASGRSRLIESGFDFQLTKPVEPQYLKAFLAFYALAADRSQPRKEEPVAAVLVPRTLPCDH